MDETTKEDGNMEFQQPSANMTKARSQDADLEKRSITLPGHDNEDASLNGDLPVIAENAVITTYMVVPPDGGWGWVVIAASFFSNLVVDGIIFSFGMYLTEISESLGESKATVAIIGSLLTGFYLMAGPFVSALANRYGFRLVAVLGSVLGCASFVISYYATSALFLCVSFGFLGGIGFGLIYVPAVITVGFYFERWRALATGIAVCGSGIGTFVMPPFITQLIAMFGWRGSLLVLSALVLNCAISGLLYRPLKPIKITMANVHQEEAPPSKTFSTPDPAAKPQESVPLMMRIKMAREDQFQKSGGSLNSIPEKVSLTADNPVTRRRILKANNNNAYPTASQVLASSMLTLYGSRMVSSQSLNRLGSNAPTNSTLTGASITVAQKRLSAPPYSDASFRDEHKTHTSAAESTPAKVAPTVTDLLKPASEEKSRVSECNLTSEERHILQRGQSRVRTISDGSRSSYRSRIGTSSKDVGVRPFYRSDIFYASSLKRLPQYTSQLSSVGYHMSVSHLPTKQDVMEETQGGCRLCPEAVQRTLATMLDMSLLKSYTFLMLGISGFITMMGFYVPFIYIKDRAIMGGMDEHSAVWLVSGIGIANTIGRVSCGVISSFPGVDSLLINNVALTIGGVATMMSGISNSSSYLFTYASVFGLATACFASLRSIIIVDLLGLDKLTNAFGLLLLFQGVAATIGSPLAGAFMEATGSYDASFYLSGSLILASAVLLYPLNWVNRWEKRRNSEAGATV